MKPIALITTIITLLSVFGASGELFIPSLFNDILMRFNLNSQFNQILSKSNVLIDTFNVKQNSIIEVIGKALNVLTKGVSSETRKLWLYLLTDFPEALLSIKIKSIPKKFNTKPKNVFDFHVSDEKFPNHKLRIKKAPELLELDKVKQYSGYLDIDEDNKHFFYMFFESRNDPENDPVILWLNGGPGCSSLTGLFLELGPSTINSELKAVYNPYSWNSNASVIFLDQPVNSGYSYSSKSVSNTIVASKDVYAFLELFFKQFPQYKKLPFHIAGESYGGHYVPVFADEILKNEDRSFNLTSIMIGNGLTDPLTQFLYYQPMGCGRGGEPTLFSPESCEKMNSTIPNCLKLIDACYNTKSVWTCVPATFYCINASISPFHKTNKNIYDMRKNCIDSDSGMCYKEIDYVTEYLNLDIVKENLGAEVDKFDACNQDVNSNFIYSGDWMWPYHVIISQLLDHGIPVLIYAGDKDYICNWLGNEAWTNKLPWSGHEMYEKETLKNWYVDGKIAGEVKNYKNFTFLRIYDAGHMVPHDQPKISLKMLNRWIHGNHTIGGYAS